MRSEYDRKAEETAKKIGLRVTRTEAPWGECPPWAREGEGEACGGCVYGIRHTPHGLKYRVTLHKGGRSLSFPFWDSLATSEKHNRPSVYSILSCLSSDMNIPTDPDEVVREFGDMLPSRAIEIARFAERLQAFFTPSERDLLSEIT